MRRLVAALAPLLAIACSGPVPEAREVDDGRLTVVATMSVFADFAEAVGGEHVEVITIVGVGGDPHTYEPTPADAAVISDADVVLDNGLGLSPWFQPLAANVRGELVVLTDGIAERAVESAGRLDPHMWMVPAYVADGYLSAIEESFSRADPAHKDTYARNADAYREQLTALDGELQALIATIPPRNRKLVTSHDAYAYFADRYGLRVVGTVIGVTTEEEPSAQSVRRLVDQVRTERVPTIFVETTVNPAVIQRVARDAGVKVGDPLYGDSVGQPGSGADTYMGMMRANARAITAGLGGDVS